jgi:hypothetical protein
VAGTIIADVIQSDQSYPSSINIASPLIVSNKVQMGTVSSANARFAAAGGIEFTSARSGLPYGALIDYAPGASQGRVCVASGNTFGVQIGNTEYARFSTVGLDLSAGSAQGIKFPATQNASADVNTLDDYEEGTWTATLAFGGASVGITYNNQGGTYTKIGNLVVCTVLLQLSNKGSSSGAATITGLPFSGPSFGSVAIGQFASTSFTDVPFGYANATTITLQQTTNAGSLSNLTNTNFTNNSQLILTIIYRT